MQLILFAAATNSAYPVRSFYRCSSSCSFPLQIQFILFIMRAHANHPVCMIPTDTVYLNDLSSCEGNGKSWSCGWSSYLVCGRPQFLTYAWAPAIPTSLFLYGRMPENYFRMGHDSPPPKKKFIRSAAHLIVYPLSYRVPVRERYGSTLLPATREQHDQNCTQSH